jgi:hypothetical protein
MVASVHVLHASPPEVGGFLRVGHTGHRKLEALLAANRLYFRRFVFDAAHIAEQIEHGVGQKETFRASGLNTPSKPGERKGSTKWIYVPELDRSFKQEQLSSLFEVRGARSRFGCNDSNCCPNGPEDMIENPHIHFITQRSRQLADLSNVPELRRAEHLLLRHLDPAVRAARLASRLHPDDPALIKAMLASKNRLVNLRDALGDLHATDSSATRSSVPMFRGKLQNLNSVAGGQKK